MPRSRPSSAIAMGRAPAAPARPLAALVRAHDLWRERRALARLDDALLRDLGLSRADVEAEIRRPLWSLPRF